MSRQPPAFPAGISLHIPQGEEYVVRRNQREGNGPGLIANIRAGDKLFLFVQWNRRWSHCLPVPDGDQQGERSALCGNRRLPVHSPRNRWLLICFKSVLRRSVPPGVLCVPVCLCRQQKSPRDSLPAITPQLLHSCRVVCQGRSGFRPSSVHAVSTQACTIFLHLSHRKTSKPTHHGKTTQAAKLPETCRT